MWAINIKLLIRLFFISLFYSKDTHYRLTGKRIKVLIIFAVLFLYGIITAWFSFLLDQVFFGKFRRQKVVQPIFIIGNFRSGSTLLHRIMAQDTANFNFFKTWEIYLAPSISQRKFFRFLLMLDNLLGKPIHRFFDSFEKGRFAPVRLHKMGMREPEEDEGILLYIWNSLFIRFFFPVPEEFGQFEYFDRLIPPSRRRRIMRFYKKCVMRHLYAHGGGKCFLSKNPSFTPKVKSLHETFPDARFIYLYRDPVETYASQMSWFSTCYGWFNSLLEPYPFKEDLIELMKLWYTYPAQVFRSMPKNQSITVNYHDFIKNPLKTVTTIYNKFKLPLTRQFIKTLKNEIHRAKNFKSSRETTAEAIGITKKELRDAFREIYEFHRFDIKP